MVMHYSMPGMVPLGDPLVDLLSDAISMMLYYNCSLAATGLQTKLVVLPTQCNATKVWKFLSCWVAPVSVVSSMANGA